jgi:hypothetical protein
VKRFRQSLWAVIIVIPFCFTTQALAVDVDYYHEGLGYINANPADDEYPDGTTVTLTAVAEPGWQFDGWEGAVTGTQNPTSFVVSGPGPMSVQANFVIIGDVDASGIVDVADAIPALQTSTGIAPAGGPHVGADVNGNGKIDAAEATHALQADAQLRPFQGPPSAGDYYNVGLEFDFDIDGGPESWMSLVELDGWGVVTSTDLYVSDPPTGPPGTAAYFVNEEGSITITVSEGSDKFQFHGFSAADASQYVIANTTPLPGFDYGIKKSTGMSNTDLNGDYLMIEYKYEDPLPITIINNVELYGNGTGWVQEIAASDGNPDFEEVDFFYSLASDGFLNIWVFVPGEGRFDLYGAVTGDTNSFSLLLNSAEDDIGVIVGIKKSTAANNSLLNGTYIYAGMEHSTIWRDELTTGRGLLTMDGAGNGTQRNLTANDAVYPAISNFTYTVDTDGTFEVTTSEGGTVPGIVSPDGETVLIIFMDPEKPGFGLGIKKTLP